MVSYSHQHGSIGALARWPRARLGVHDDSDNDGEKTRSRGEDDDDQHGDESGTVLRGNESSGGTQHADTDAAEHVGETNSDTDPEGSEAGVLGLLPVRLAGIDVIPRSTNLLLGRNKKGNDKSVNTASFAQNDANQVLGLDAGHLDERTENGR